LKLLDKMEAKTIIIDGKGAVFGRLCSFVAKRALEGNEVIVINSENVVITGNKKDIIEKYRSISQKGGHSLKGPKYPKISYQMLKRGMRGMLPDFRGGQGKLAFKKITCYDRFPKEFEDKKIIKIRASKKSKYIELKELLTKI